MPVLALLAGCGGGEDQKQGGNEAASAAAPPVGAPSPIASPGPSPRPEPVFTSLARADCRLVEEKSEEAGYARFLCPGRGDYRLEVVEADGREDIALRRGDDAARAMQLPSRVARGAFSRLGQTAQWVRGDRLIVRYDVEQPDGRPAVSSLLVIDLPAACLVSIVPPGAGQNEAALRAAEALPDCLRDGDGSEGGVRARPM